MAFTVWPCLSGLYFLPGNCDAYRSCCNPMGGIPPLCRKACSLEKGFQSRFGCHLHYRYHDHRIAGEWNGNDLAWTRCNLVRASRIEHCISIRLDGDNSGNRRFYVAWWLHLLIILSFLVYIPQSKHAHLIAGPINVFLNRLDNPGN